MAETASQTREALLTAAKGLFSVRGYAAVGIRQIAESAGANIASIKYHFGSKHALYLETVRRAMATHDPDELVTVLTAPSADRRGAAVKLARFIRAFFGHIAARPSMDACGALLIREALTPSEAIDAVVRDYLKPRTQEVTATLAAIDPAASAEQTEQLTHALFGQLLHFRVFRPFIERLNGIDLADKRVADEVARHVAAFSLRGLGCDEQLVAEVLEQAWRADEALPGGIGS
jgi:AcrR family transcriptional regulator